MSKQNRNRQGDNLPGARPQLPGSECLCPRNTFPVSEMQREKSAIARETRTQTDHGATFSDRRVDDLVDACRTRYVFICANHSCCMLNLDRDAGDRPGRCGPRRGGSCFMAPGSGGTSCSEVGLWLGLADYGFGSAAAGPAAGVGAVFIGVAQVAFEFAPEAGLLGDQVAGEGRLPARSDDRALDPLDAAVVLRSAGVDEAMAVPSSATVRP